MLDQFGIMVIHGEDGKADTHIHLNKAQQKEARMAGQEKGLTDPAWTSSDSHG